MDFIWQAFIARQISFKLFGFGELKYWVDFVQLNHFFAFSITLAQPYHFLEIFWCMKQENISVTIIWGAPVSLHGIVNISIYISCIIDLSMLKIISKLLFIEILSIKNNKILNLRCGTLFEGKREIFLHIALIRIICGWDSLSYLLFWLLIKGDKTDRHKYRKTTAALRAAGVILK